MALLLRRPSWQLRERDLAPEAVFCSRRRFLARALGAAAAVSPLARALAARASEDARHQEAPAGVYSKPGTHPALATIEAGSPNADLYPARRNTRYELDRPTTDEVVAATSNNFYEFSTTKGAVWRLVEKFRTRPWTLEVTGLVHKPATFEVDRLIRRIGVEERLYRLRCVEAWSIAVPWTGFELRKLLALVEPHSSARYVRFVSFHDRDVAAGQRDEYFPWPYYEGLRIDEAMNELTILATGIYGHELPKQHGAPIRLVVPWKYGFKSIKSLVRIELTNERPRTFWSDVVPTEYDFLANVDPNVPHARWSQATETALGTGEVRRTLPYNGYATYVAGLYRATEGRSG